jgi:hypothetical protein
LIFQPYRFSRVTLTPRVLTHIARFFVHSSCLLATIATLATLCTWTATYECRFFEISKVFVQDPDIAISFGLWTVENYYHLETVQASDLCVGWGFHRTLDESDLDMPMRLARVSGGTACFLSLLILVAVLVHACVAFRDNQLSFLASCMFMLSALTMMCQVCMLSNFCRGAGECRIAKSGILCIAASVLWFLAGFALLSLKKRGFEFKQALPLFADDTTEEEHIPLSTVTNEGNVRETTND